MADLRLQVVNQSCGIRLNLSSSDYQRHSLAVPGCGQTQPTITLTSPQMHKHAIAAAAAVLHHAGTSWHHMRLCLAPQLPPAVLIQHWRRQHRPASAPRTCFDPNFCRGPASGACCDHTRRHLATVLGDRAGVLVGLSRAMNCTRSTTCCRMWGSVKCVKTMSS